MVSVAIFLSVELDKRGKCGNFSLGRVGEAW